MPRNDLAKALNLARLPKARNTLRSLNYKGTTPGEAAPFFNKHRDSKAYHPKDPAFFQKLTALSRKTPFRPWILPSVETPTFILRVIPKRLLSERQDTNPLVCRSKAGRADMSLFTTVSKKVHKHAVIRTRIRFRVKEALGLIVTRGVSGDPAGGTLSLVEDDVGPEKWILSDWTYVIFPNLGLYRRPLPELINDLRTALKDLKEKAEIWETGLKTHSTVVHFKDFVTSPSDVMKPTLRGPKKFDSPKKTSISKRESMPGRDKPDTIGSNRPTKTSTAPSNHHKRLPGTTFDSKRTSTQNSASTPEPSLKEPSSWLPKRRAREKRRKPWEPPTPSTEPPPPSSAETDPKSLASFFKVLGDVSSKAGDKEKLLTGSTESRLFRSNIVVVPPKEDTR